ncbi:MAG: DinB family protein [Flavihumibacter sp.]
MESVFEQIRQSRRAFLAMIQPLSTAQLNRIPAGYNNNIIWNLGHIVASTVSLCYKRTNVAPGKPIPLARAYGKGTKPEAPASEAEIEQIKQELLTSINELESDYQAGVFKNTTPFSTDTYKGTLSTIEEVIVCTLAHDNYHFGYASSLKKSIQ